MTRRTSLLAASMALAGALGLWFGCQGCASPPAPELRQVVLGEVEDVLEGTGDALTLCGGLPAVFLVGDATQAEDLLAERAALAQEATGEARVACVVDVSSLDELGRTALADRLTEAALDDGGPILLDASGATARSLRDGAPGLFRIVLNGEGRVTAIQALVRE